MLFGLTPNSYTNTTKCCLYISYVHCTSTSSPFSVLHNITVLWWVLLFFSPLYVAHYDAATVLNLSKCPLQLPAENASFLVLYRKSRHFETKTTVNSLYLYGKSLSGRSITLKYIQIMIYTQLFGVSLPNYKKWSRKKITFKRDFLICLSN